MENKFNAMTLKAILTALYEGDSVSSICNLIRDTMETPVNNDKVESIYDDFKDALERYDDFNEALDVCEAILEHLNDTRMTTATIEDIADVIDNNTIYSIPCHPLVIRDENGEINYNRLDSIVGTELAEYWEVEDIVDRELSKCDAPYAQYLKLDFQAIGRDYRFEHGAPYFGDHYLVYVSE